MRVSGNLKPEFLIAACTRSRASRTAASPRPTIANAGRPGRMSISTQTWWGSTRSIAKAQTRPSTAAKLLIANSRVGDAACKIGATRRNVFPQDCRERYPIRRGIRRTVVAMDRRDVGRRGEELAADHLVRRGFSILARNFRTRWGELDIVAFDGRTLVFCEVKSRRCSGAQNQAGWTAGVPFESLHPRKRYQVRKMANAWMSNRLERPYAPLIRFDAIGVTFEARGELVRLEHLEGAF